MEEFALTGKVVAELKDDSVREVSLYSYRILYEIKSDHLQVLAVIHKRRNLQSDEIAREQ